MRNICVFFCIFFLGGGRREKGGGAGVVPAVLEETLSQDYLFFSYADQFVRRSGNVLAILVEGMMGNIIVKLI